MFVGHQAIIKKLKTVFCIKIISTDINKEHSSMCLYFIHRNSIHSYRMIIYSL